MYKSWLLAWRQAGRGGLEGGCWLHIHTNPPFKGQAAFDLRYRYVFEVKAEVAAKTWTLGVCLLCVPAVANVSLQQEYRFNGQHGR